VGSAGFFNRIGLVGIPLAVALLACVLYGLVFAAVDHIEIARAFLDLAKLTTGAFIGALSTSPRQGRQIPGSNSVQAENKEVVS
jgi:hypothetical protein